MSKKKEEKPSYKESFEWALRHIADGIIKEGFGSMKSSLMLVLHVFRVGEKDGWKEDEQE